MADSYSETTSCSSCGAAIKPGETTCWLCARRIEAGIESHESGATPPPIPPAAQKKSGWAFYILLFVMALMSLVFSFVTAGGTLILFIVVAVSVIVNRGDRKGGRGVAIALAQVFGLLVLSVASIVALIFAICAVTGPPNFR